MRICYLSPWFPYPLDTGSRTRVYYLLKALTSEHEVTLLTLNPAGWSLPEMQPVAELCEETAVFFRDPYRRGRFVENTRFFSLRPIVAKPFAALLRKIEQLHKERSFDVVIAATYVMAEYALAIGQVPRVLEEHNSMSRWMEERYIGGRSWKNRLRYWTSWQKANRYERKLMKQFDLVTMVSEQDAIVARRLLNGQYPPVEIYPNGVAPEDISEDLSPSHPFRLVYSGALAYQVNYEAMDFFLGQIWPLILRKMPQAKLHITGRNDGISTEHLRMTEGVSLTGFLKDIKSEIASAEVAIAPIISGGGTRLKILEAMALGTPVVATTKGAEGLNAVNGKHLMIANSPKEFARQVLMLFENKNLRQQIAIQARNFVATRYDWNDIGERFSSRVGRLRSGESNS